MEKSFEYMYNFVRKQMDYKSQVHFITTYGHSLQYYCEFLPLNCSSIRKIQRAFPLVDIFIQDGLLQFDFDKYYGE